MKIETKAVLPETQLFLLELLLAGKFPLEDWDTDNLIKLLYNQTVPLKHYSVSLRLPMLLVHSNLSLQTLEMIEILKKRKEKCK